jgi:hypothetical protein
MAQHNHNHNHSHGQYTPATDHRQPSPTPRTRSSTESSATKASLVRRDSLQHANGEGAEDVVPTSFDENALRVLIEMDVRTLFHDLDCNLLVADA